MDHGDAPSSIPHAKSSHPPPPPPPPPQPLSQVQIRFSPQSQRLSSQFQFRVSPQVHFQHLPHPRPPPPPRPQHSNEERCSIHRVPHRMGEVKPIAYEPNVISIGPYHYDKEHLKAMEVMKRSCFATIVKTKNLEYSEFAKSMIFLKDRVRECYEGPIHQGLDKNSDEFIGMMIYDGCFIVWLIRDGYPEDVCKLGRHIRIDIWHDLLLLENQLPFFLLLELDRIITKSSTQAQKDFSAAALSFFRNNEYGPQMWFRRATRPSSKEQEPSSNKGNVAERKGEENKERVDHLLDLVYKCCRPSPQGIERHQKYSQKLGMECQRSWKFIRSATGLDDAGINFSGKKVLQDQGLQVEVQVLQDQDQGLKDEVQGLFDIMFTRVPIRKIPIHNKVFEVPIHDNVLEIPRLVVDDNTERMLRNLLAYEQFNETNAPTYVYDYVMFMDNLINTDKDVQLLSASGVIDNWLGGDEAVAQMFNKLRDKVYSSKDFYYAEIFDMVDKHCEQKWNRHRAKLCKDYFGSPWSICSFVAAFVLLGFTVVQSVYACIAYYHPSSKK